MINFILKSQNFIFKVFLMKFDIQEKQKKHNCFSCILISKRTIFNKLFLIMIFNSGFDQFAFIQKYFGFFFELFKLFI